MSITVYFKRPHKTLSKACLRKMFFKITTKVHYGNSISSTYLENILILSWILFFNFLCSFNLYLVYYDSIIRIPNHSQLIAMEIHGVFDEKQSKVKENATSFLIQPFYWPPAKPPAIYIQTLKFQLSSKL